MPLRFLQLRRTAPRVFFILLFCFISGVLWGTYTHWKGYKDHFQKELRILIIKNTIPEDIIEAFRIDRDIRVTVTYAHSENEVSELLELTPQSFDLITVMSSQVERLIQIEKIEKLQKSRFAREKIIATDFRYPPHDPNGDYTIPLLWGINGYILNRNFIKDGINSLNDMFQQKYKKKIYLNLSPLDIFAFLSDSNSSPPEILQESTLLPANSAISDLVTFIKGPVDEVKKQLLNEDIWIAQVDSGLASEFLEDNQKFKYLIPEDGAYLWTLSLALMSGADNTVQAYDFINYIFKPEVTASLAKLSRHAVTNLRVDNMSSIHKNLKPSFLRTVSIKKIKYHE